jgi:hypothetical protein
MENTTDSPRALSASDLFGDLRPLVKGDTVKRGDVFVDDGQRFEMSRSGVLLGCYCLGKTIIKNNGGWFRPSPN